MKYVLVFLGLFSLPLQAERTLSPKKNAQRQTTTATTKSSTRNTNPSQPLRRPSAIDVGTVETPVMTSTEAVTGINPRFYFSSGFGVSVLQRPGLALNMQLPFSLSKKRNYYLGPDVTYALYSPGTSLIPALGAWYDLRIYGAPRLSCIFGLILGPVFNAGLDFLPPTSYAALVDVALVQEVDDLISVKGQFRPGLLGGYLTYVMSFQVAFRFL